MEAQPTEVNPTATAPMEIDLGVDKSEKIQFVTWDAQSQASS